jgi:hypothetical protein
VARISAPRIKIAGKSLSEAVIDFIKVYSDINAEKSTPGPGDYTANLMHADGVYLLSTMKGSGRRAILNEKR